MRDKRPPQHVADRDQSYEAELHGDLEGVGVGATTRDEDGPEAADLEPLGHDVVVDVAEAPVLVDVGADSLAGEGFLDPEQQGGEHRLGSGEEADVSIADFDHGSPVIISIIACDNIGNCAAPVYRYITVDAEPPELSYVNIYEIEP